MNENILFQRKFDNLGRLCSFFSFHNQHNSNMCSVRPLDFRGSKNFSLNFTPIMNFLKFH